MDQPDVVLHTNKLKARRAEHDEFLYYCFMAKGALLKVTEHKLFHTLPVHIQSAVEIVVKNIDRRTDIPT